MKLDGKTLLVLNLPRDLEEQIRNTCDTKRMKLHLLEDHDARDLLALREKVNGITNRDGGIDLLLIFDQPARATGLIRETKISVFDEYLATFWSILNLIYATYPHMMLANRGRMLLVLPSTGFEGYPNHAACCLRGGALAGMFETFTQEAGEFNVTVSILHQPYLNGSLFRGHKKKSPSSVLKSIFHALQTSDPILFNRKFRKMPRLPLPSSVESFQDKVILVTGAASGIGEMFGRSFARKGAKVVLTDINEPELERVHSTIQSYNSSCIKILLDVSNRAIIDQVFKQVIDEFGQLDILINNAGIAISGLLRHLTLRDFRKTLGVNLLGPLYLAEKTIPIFLQQNSGYMINVASIDACCPLPFLSPYNASKRALRFYSNILRMELQKHGICVTTVYPGAVGTNISANADIKRESFSDGYLSAESLLEGSYISAYTPFQLAQKVIEGMRRRDSNQFQLPLTNKLLLGLWRGSPELILPILRGAVKNMVRKWQFEKYLKKEK